MTDGDDVRGRLGDAWRDAAARAYEAAHGLVDAQPEEDDSPRWRFAWRPRVALTAVLALALVAGVVTWWPAGASGVPVAEPPPGLTGNPSGEGVDDGVGVDGRGAGVAVTVHVAGAVAQPGLYEVPSGSRVADAVEAAGGALDPADLDALNLARVLTDGEKVTVGAAAETEGDGLINLNTASQQALTELPGVGPVLAARIVAYREEHGPFASVDALDAVSGVGPAVLAGLRDAATV